MSALEELISFFEAEFNVKLQLGAADSLLAWLSQYDTSESQSRLYTFLEVLDALVADTDLEDGINVETVQNAIGQIAANEAASEVDVALESPGPASAVSSPLRKDPEEEAQLKHHLKSFALEVSGQTAVIDIEFYKGDKGRDLPYFDTSHQRWTRLPKRPSIAGGINAQATMFSQRIHLVLERVKLLTYVKWWTIQSSVNVCLKDTDIVLRSVEQARGVQGYQHVLGILRSQERIEMETGAVEWVWILEDITSQINLNLDDYSRNEEFILNGIVVIASGIMQGSTLRAMEVRLPWPGV
eukprot:Blabericola_migrator_1__13487@NODE_97_length_14383_cov_97_669181_g87_i0_p7_GENE_NODE_97_length_14383_cov_97_669181_g87_i0NODE_97_length_14383_cov_97_669181_g87_i0_p7_ORF_typecomplete_len298_score75_46_NODE_97_length_14383_cov_97_669181_g87_i028403733